MDREELENQKTENTAMKVAKEETKKQVKKQTKKMVMHIVKTVVIPILLKLWWLFAIIMGVCIIFSAFNLVVNSEDEEEEEYIAVVEEIDITSEEWITTEEEITNFITNYNTEYEDLRTVILGKTSDILKWQTDNGYSAMFLITVAFEEYSPTEEEVVEEENTTAAEEEYFTNFLNSMNEKVTTWKENKYTTIKQIAESYVGDETTETWANTIQNKMYENSESDTN